MNGGWAKDKRAQSESLFGLLNIFCETANIEWLSKEYGISKADAVSYIFSLLSQKLYREEFKDSFSKASKFENGKMLKENLSNMEVNLANIDFSKSAPVILTKEEKNEKDKEYFQQ